MKNKRKILAMFIVCIIFGICAIKQTYADNNNGWINQDKLFEWTDMKKSFYFNVLPQGEKGNSSYHYKNGLYCIDKDKNASSQTYNPNENWAFRENNKNNENVDDEFKNIQDKLKYIIANEPSATVVDKTTNSAKRKSTNIAIWLTIAGASCDSETEAEDLIFDDRTNWKKGNDSGLHRYYWNGYSSNRTDYSAWEYGWALYKEACTYANSLNSSHNINEEVKINVTSNNMLQITYDSNVQRSEKITIYNKEDSYICEVNNKETLSINPEDKKILSGDELRVVYSEYYYDGYAKIYTGKNITQRLMLGNAWKYQKEDKIKVPALNSNISLQKYITQIIHNNDVVDDLKTDRRNMVLKPLPTDGRELDSHNYWIGNKNYGYWSPSIIKNPSSGNENIWNKGYKWDNPVEIIDGDEVVYAIELYNNSNTTAKNIRLTDAPSTNTFEVSQIYEKNNNKTKKLYKESQSLEGIKKWRYEYITHPDGTTQKKITIKSGNLTPGQSRTIYVRLKYNYTGNGDQFLGNEVGLHTEPVNETEYRTYDGDYTILRRYSVSLEKYVSKVESKDLKDCIYINNNDNREGKRYNSNASDRSNTENYNTYKKDHPVLLENGDKVTFTIKLKNTGNNPVKITQLDDWHSKELTVDNTYKIDYGGTVEKQGGDGDQYDIITFSQPKLLAAGETVNITIRYNLEVKNNPKTEFFNIARIREIKNEKNRTVLDWDGTDNNQDEDHVKFKEYKVSLEKYIKQVVTSKNHTISHDGRRGRAEHMYNEEEYKEGYTPNKNMYKNTNVVSADCGSEITYIVILNNDGDTFVNFKHVLDTLPEHTTSYKVGNAQNFTPVPSNRNIYLTGKGIGLNGGKSCGITVTIKTDAPNLSLDTYTNTATIEHIHNKNNVLVMDSTPYNNTDSDYFKMNPEQQSLSVKVFKVWEGFTDNEIETIGEIKVALKKDGTKIKEATLNSSNNWTYIWNDLEKLNKNGNKINYTVEEISKKEISNISKFTSRIDEISTNVWKITNTKTIEENTQVSVKKVWNDSNNLYGKRPDSISVQLYKNGEPYNNAENLNKANSWEHSWTNLPKYDGNKNEIEYTVKEVSVPEGYKSSIEYDRNNNCTNIIIVNEYNVPDYISKTVKKVWEGFTNNEIKTIGDIEVALKKDGTEIETVKLNADNNWTYTWTNLIKNAKYEIEEKTTGNFITKIESTSENEWTITNTKDTPDSEKINVLVQKVWKDFSTSARPASIKVKLYQDGKQYGDVIELNEPNSWKHSWENLPKYDEEKNKIEYTVEEVEVPNGYEAVIECDEGSNSISFIVNNTYKNEYVSKTVIKEWKGDENQTAQRPRTIKVGLYANNELIGTQEISTENSDTQIYTWDNLLKYDDNGIEINYTAKELDQNNNPIADFKPNGNYMVRYDSSTAYDVIVNTYNKTEISVIKSWNVDNNSLIQAIQVQLYKNGNACGDAVTLSKDENWIHKWTDLPKYDEYGIEYKYTVAETTSIAGISVSTYKLSEKSWAIINEEVTEDAIIAGIVWNDVALNKTSTSYNCQYDNGKESLLSGIKVYLYRYGVETAVAQTTTDSNGYYCFKNSSLDPNVITNPKERYIKAKIQKDNNKWDIESGYYSYTVVFEYDGIKYTSTFSNEQRIWNIKKNSIKSQYSTTQYSNAQENKETRDNFNKNFAIINNSKGITYETINEADNLPQSRYVYDSGSMSINSSTEKINIGDYSSKTDETYLQHVNLGLRGRDTLDLDLTSDVSSVDVTVNGQTGTYNYANEVDIRKEDIYPDAAHIQNETRTTSYTSVDQKIRATDITNTHYDETRLGIKVTYKITVTNESSITKGTATKIVNYFDSRYNLVTIVGGKGNITNKGNYKELIINVDDTTTLNPEKSRDIYVTLVLNNPVDLLKDLNMGEKLPTYNMAEIYEYKSECAEGQSEYTRGLIDVDSAPGSAEIENVRLTNGQIGNISTVQYYFNAQNLNRFKFEDDTFTAPVLYFVKDGNMRKIEGNVFEDATSLVNGNVRTGNGIIDTDELKVYGATIELLEQVGNDQKTRFTAKTNENGYYSFEGFLPGNYVIRFKYGDTIDTVILNTYSNGINQKSFNGEDYQATNNTGTYGAYSISPTENYWYLANEKIGVSTATDESTRRIDVSNFIYNKYGFMNTLNDIRSGKKFKEEDIRELINGTYMYANTKAMKFDVEKASINSNSTENKTFTDYVITNMNFGIAEVPVSTIDLQKHVKELEIVDSAGINTIAKIVLKEDGTYNVVNGEVLAAGVNEPIDVSIENEKLQGAKLRITYAISAEIKVEKNYNDEKGITPTIKGLYDFIDNNLEYNQTLGENSKYWELTSYDEMQKQYKKLKLNEDSLEPQSTVASDSNKYKVIIKTTPNNPILSATTGQKKEVELVLEKVLSSNDSGIEEIKMKDIQNMLGYMNTIEIQEINYSNTGGDKPLRDRVRTTDRHIIVPGGSRDTATSEEIVIHPPTGDGGAIGITYYIVGLASLCILAVGIFGIKKFVIKR